MTVRRYAMKGKWGAVMIVQTGHVRVVLKRVVVRGGGRKS